MKVGDLIAQYFELSRMTAQRHRAGFGIILRVFQVSRNEQEYEVLWPDGVISIIGERDGLSYEEYMGSQAMRWMGRKINEAG